MAWDCRGPKKNKGRDNPMEKEKIMKIVQKMMVKCNNKPEVFSRGDDYRTNCHQE